MATVLEGYTSEEQRSVAHFLWAKELNTKDVNIEMFIVYGGKCLSRKAVHWVEKCGNLFADDEAVEAGGAEVVKTIVWRIYYMQEMLSHRNLETLYITQQ
jgi:hypothetical protein